MRRQPIYAFFEGDSTLGYLPLGLRERLRHEHNQDQDAEGGEALTPTP